MATGRRGAGLPRPSPGGWGSRTDPKRGCPAPRRLRARPDAGHGRPGDRIWPVPSPEYSRKQFTLTSRRPLPGGHPAGEEHSLSWEGCAVMGIVNATPDSFSDGGRYLDPYRAVYLGTLLAH